jgi:hypothetical protein
MECASFKDNTNLFLVSKFLDELLKKKNKDKVEEHIMNQISNTAGENLEKLRLSIFLTLAIINK